MISSLAPNKLRKIYRQIIEDDCIPLSEIPLHQQEAFVNDYLLRGKTLDFDLMKLADKPDFENPFPFLHSTGVQKLFTTTKMIREANAVIDAFTSSKNVTQKLQQLAAQYGISFLVSTSFSPRTTFLCGIPHSFSSFSFSSTRVGRRVFVNNIHISNIETGKKAPSIDLLIELANALEVSADDLLVDSLAHPSSTADTVLHQLLLDCNDVEERVLVELVKYMKTVLYRLGI